VDYLTGAPKEVYIIN